MFDVQRFHKSNYSVATQARKQNRRVVFQKIRKNAAQTMPSKINVVDAVVMFGMIQINQHPDGSIYIGQNVNGHFTHKFIRLQRSELQQIPLMFEQLKQKPQGVIKFPVSQVVMKKDVYKGVTLYGLRFYNYYAGNLQVTRTGFNLTEQEMKHLSKAINDQVSN